MSDALVVAMSDPAFYPHRPDSVELRETHISLVFLAGELVYKVKKPVVFAFGVDYTTLERRRHFCHEEVRLNRRLAPDTYLGVRAIARRDGGLALAEADDRDAIEYAVEMRRLPEERTLARLLEHGAADDRTVARVAERLAEFHAQARPASPPAGTPRTVKRTLDDNFEELLRAAGHGADPAAVRAVERFSDAFLAGRSELFEQRLEGGRVRECHGDLRAEHVVVEDEIEVFDCVDFSPALREIDVAADLAFLVMDIEMRGSPRHAAALERAYRDAGGDPGPAALLAFYAAYRACVRAKVAALRAEQEGGAAAALGATLALARRFCWRARAPLALVLCGVSGSGKSWLARGLAEVSGAEPIGSDAVRKELAGVTPTEPVGPERYSPEWNERTYRALAERTAAVLGARGLALVDATFRHQADRRAFFESLGPAWRGAVVAVECRAPLSVLLERTRRRAEGPTISDAGPELVERQLAEFAPLDELAPERHLVVRTDRQVEALVEEVEAMLDARLAMGAL